MTTTAAQPDRLAVVYDRASTARQRDNYSRDDAARLPRLAEARGWPWELRQEIKSGEDLVNRPVMRGILQDVADGRIRAIIVQHLDRLSRDQDQIDGRIIRQVCRDNDCVVLTPDKEFDFRADADDDLADVQFLMAKFQKRSIVRQTVTGMKEAARQGKRLPSLVPVGYDAVFTPAERADLRPLRDFVVNDDEATLVRRIFDLYELHSHNKVAKLLNAEGLRWPVKNRALSAKYGGRTDRPFTGSSIYDVVGNELYAGFVTWAKERRSRLLRDFEPVRIFRPDLQIVTVEQWNRVERVRADRRRLPPRSVSSPYLFSGLLKCRHCGRALTGVRKKSKPCPEYWCTLRTTGGTAACPGQSVAESMARSAVTGFLRHLFAERIALEPFIAGAARRYGPDRTEEELTQEVRAELQTVAHHKRNLVDAVAAGLLGAEDIKAKHLDLEEQRERLERRLAAAGGRLEMRAEIAAAVRLLEGEGLAARLAHLPDPALQRLCRLIFRRLTFDGTGRGHNRLCHVERYEFTPEFSDFLAHHGAHVAPVGFDGPMSLRRLGLGFPTGR